METPKRGLIVREPYASMIVDGRKTWEIRKSPTRVRGRIGIVAGGRLIGEVEVVDVLGPFSVRELEEHEDKHRAGGFLQAYAQGRPLWAWVLKNPRRYEKPIPVPRRRGRMIWVDLSEVGAPD